MASHILLPDELISRIAPRDGARFQHYSGDLESFGPAPGAEMVVLRYPAEKTNRDTFREMKSLKVVQALTSGVDHVIGSTPAHARLYNAPTLHAAPTAETAMSLILASLNRVPEWVDAQRRGLWRDPGPRTSLHGRTVVVLGHGAVGRALSTMLAGFGTRTVPVARSPRPGVRGMEELPDLIGAADVLVVAVPLSDSTRGLVGPEFLGRMRDGALLVNVARGPVVDSGALLAEVSTGRLRAALDVVDPEPLPADHPLWTCPGVLISPHVGGNTVDFWDRAATFVAAQIQRFSAGEPLHHPVDG